MTTAEMVFNKEYLYLDYASFKRKYPLFPFGDDEELELPYIMESSDGTMPHTLHIGAEHQEKLQPAIDALSWEPEMHWF